MLMVAERTLEIGRARKRQKMVERGGVHREEVLRLLMQALRDMNCNASVRAIEEETGLEFESSWASELRQAVLSGKWETVIQKTREIKVEDAKLLKLVYTQKFLEFLEWGNVANAISCLRDELLPVGLDDSTVQLLCRFVLCKDENDVRRSAKWDGAYGGSRLSLLMQIQGFYLST